MELTQHVFWGFLPVRHNQFFYSKKEECGVGKSFRTWLKRNVSFIAMMIVIAMAINSLTAFTLISQYQLQKLVIVTDNTNVKVRVAVEVLDGKIKNVEETVETAVIAAKPESNSNQKEIVYNTLEFEGATEGVNEETNKGFPELASEEYLLAQIIECEAGKTYEDRIYVGSVLINRARTDYYSFRTVSTISEVLYQDMGKQYDIATISKIEAGIKPSEESLEVAKGLISGEIECLEERILFQTKERPTGSWADNLEDIELNGSCQYYGAPKDFITL